MRSVCECPRLQLNPGDRVAVAALVLNFVPDASAALREMTPVTVNGGRVAACVWDYAGRWT